MKVVIIGLGSMGKRRIRLISTHDESIQIIGVDINEERRESCNKEYNIETFTSIKDTLDKNHVDCAFVCTSPLSHSKIIMECLSQGIHIFSELNLVTDYYEENIALAKKNDLVLFMSSTFLYREEIKHIKMETEKAKCMLNYTYHTGQYLPDWHPWENYKDFFVGDKRSNGCREILAIELPWLIDVFGDIVNVEVIKSKMSSLDLNYDDNYLMLIQHNTGHKGTLAVDVVSRKAVRNLDVYGENLYLHWDGSPTGLYVYDFEAKKDQKVELYSEIDHLDNYSRLIIENAYLNEITSFFKAVRLEGIPFYNFEKDKKILDIIDRIEA